MHLLGEFIRSIEDLGREDAVNALLCGCSLYRIITLEESMGSELPNVADSTPTDDISQSNNEVKRDNEKGSIENKNSDDLFPTNPMKAPLASQTSSSRETRDVNTAVKNTSQLSISNSERDGSISSHMSMSVSGQARVNNNVSR